MHVNYLKKVEKRRFIKMNPESYLKKLRIQSLNENNVLV